MALETGTYISDLNASNPVNASDNVSQGDDHLRLIKATLKATFPNITGAVTPTHTELNLLAGKTGTVWTSANDGAGSGLDADLLDGQSSAYYRDAGNLNAGTLPDARVAQSNVTQHQAALAIAGSQVTSGTVAVAQGGTAASTAANARTNLGIGSIATRALTIQSGGSPSGGSDGDVFFIY